MMEVLKNYIESLGHTYVSFIFDPGLMEPKGENRINLERFFSLPILGIGAMS